MSPLVTRVLSVIVVAVISRRRRCSDQASHRTDGSADRGAHGGTVTTGSSSPDRSSAGRADETAADRPLDGIIGIGASR